MRGGLLSIWGQQTAGPPAESISEFHSGSCFLFSGITEPSCIFPVKFSPMYPPTSPLPLCLPSLPPPPVLPYPNILLICLPPPLPSEQKITDEERKSRRTNLPQTIKLSQLTETAKSTKLHDNTVLAKAKGTC